MSRQTRHRLQSWPLSPISLPLKTPQTLCGLAHRPECMDFQGSNYHPLAGHTRMASTGLPQPYHERRLEKVGHHHQIDLLRPRACHLSNINLNPLNKAGSVPQALQTFRVLEEGGSLMDNCIRQRILYLQSLTMCACLSAAVRLLRPMTVQYPFGHSISHLPFTNRTMIPMAIGYQGTKRNR